MKKNLFIRILFILVLAFILVTFPACVKNSAFDVTFKDVNGEELEKINVKYGENAIYSDIQSLVDKYYEYDDKNVTMFVGWDKCPINITNSKKNLVLTAQVKTITREQNGEYPQTLITDENIINELKTLEPDERGYITYEGKKYARTDENNEVFEDGEYFKLVEPVKWRYFFQTDDGNIEFVSNDILALKQWHYTDYVEDGTDDYDFKNNYAKSDIRSWLNSSDFFDKIFSDASLVQITKVDNSTASTRNTINEYVCEDTNDKLYLLSYQEVFKFYFANANNKLYYDGFLSDWWLRSPTDLFPNCANCVSNGDPNFYKVTEVLGIRPAVTLKID